MKFLAPLLLLAACAQAGPEIKGSLIVLNKAEGTASLINLATSKSVRTIKTGLGPNEVMVSPSGKVAVISNMGNQTPDKTLTVVTLPSGDITRTIDLDKHGRPHGIAWLTEDRILMTSHGTDSLVSVNITTGTVESAIPTGERGTHMVVLSPDKKRAYASNATTGTVSVADLTAGKIIATIPCGARAEGIAISPDGKTVTCGNVGANTVSVIDTATLKVTHTLPNTAAPIRTIWTKDGRSVLVSCPGTGEIAVFDPKTWTETKRIKLADQAIKFDLKGQPNLIPMNFAVHEDGQHIFVVLVASNAIAILDMKTMTVVGKLETGPTPDGIALSLVSIG